MLDPQNQQPQTQNPPTPKPQTRMFTNVEYNEEDIKLIKIQLKPINRLNVMSEEVNELPYVGPWNWGLHPVFLSFEEMKKYAIDHETWEEKKETPNIEEMVNIHISESIATPIC